MNASFEANCIVTAATPLTPPAVGSVWPSQGGIYLGIIPAMFTMPARHLIVSADDATLAWGPYGERTEGADSHHDGRANTAALVAAKTEHPAAQWAANLSTGGFGDWFLPSRMELLHAFYVSKTVFDESQWHWTSTENAATFAFAQYFRRGHSDCSTTIMN